MVYERRFGEIPGQPEGTTYESRKEVRRAGLHADNERGISGKADEGADAIVLSGGYADHDKGDVIIYTGHGGQHRDTRKQEEDQTFNAQGNAALVKSKLEGHLVRVIRGAGKTAHNRSPYAPSEGYRYDGLYRVVRSWYDTESEGFRLCRFLLVKDNIYPDTSSLDGLELLESDAQLAHPPDEPPGRVERKIKSIIRNHQVVNSVKKLHTNHCQICKNTIRLPSGPFSEAAHIRPLGFPHNGVDAITNVLCLCPNDHIRFDNGAIYLTDELDIFDAMAKKTVGELRTAPKHTIDISYVQYHRRIWSV